MKGIFLINKPKNITSHGVVNFLRRLTGERKVGHAGTLDPMATGLMIVAVGREFTKKLASFVKLDKEYVAKICFGWDSTTYDAEGALSFVSKRKPFKEEIGGILKTFLGKQKQAPPIFSAKKVGGQTAYKLARKGKSVKIPKQNVEIYSIEVINYDYPKLILKVRVSSGTYIRSLACDIGKKLKVGAYLCGLRRTVVGSYKIRQSRRPKSLKESEDLAKIQIRLDEVK